MEVCQSGDGVVGSVGVGESCRHVIRMVNASPLAPRITPFGEARDGE